MLDQFFFYFPPLALNEGPFKLDLTSKLAAPAMAFLFREVAFGATLLKHGQLAVHTHIALLSLTHLLQLGIVVVCMYYYNACRYSIGSDSKKVFTCSIVHLI